MAIPYEPRPKINVTNDECPDKLREVLWVLYKLRKYKKKWDEEHGFQNRKNLQLWEDNADKLLEELITKP